MVGCKKDKANPTIANSSWTYGELFDKGYSIVEFWSDGTGHITEYSKGFNGLVDANTDFSWTESYDDRISYLNVTIKFTDDRGRAVTRDGGMYKDELSLGGIEYTKD